MLSCRQKRVDEGTQGSTSISVSGGVNSTRWKICKELYTSERFEGTFLTTTDAANNPSPYYRLDCWLIHVSAILTRLWPLVGGRGTHSVALWFPTFKAVSHINDFFELRNEHHYFFSKRGRMGDFSSACKKRQGRNHLVCVCVCVGE